MSVTQDYKSVTFNGSEAFAVARALRGRIDSMVSLEGEAVALGRPDLASYGNEQKEAAESALAELNAVPLRAVAELKAAAMGTPAPKRVQFDDRELELVRYMLEDAISECNATLLSYPFGEPENDEACKRRNIAQCALSKVRAA